MAAGLAMPPGLLPDWIGLASPEGDWRDGNRMTQGLGEGVLISIGRRVWSGRLTGFRRRMRRERTRKMPIFRGAFRGGVRGVRARFRGALFGVRPVAGRSRRW
jgi:hypothetical protein